MPQIASKRDLSVNHIGFPGREGICTESDAATDSLTLQRKEKKSLEVFMASAIKMSLLATNIGIRMITKQGLHKTSHISEAADRDLCSVSKQSVCPSPQHTHF